MNLFKSFIKQHRVFAVLLVAESLLLLLHFAFAMRVQAPIVLSGNELTALSQNAVISDGSISMQDNEDYGPFAETPLLTLKKGSYIATVTYTSSMEGAKVFQDNDYIVMNEQELEASDSYASFSLWARGNTSTTFKFTYNGGQRSIQQFTLTPTHAYARVSSLGLLFFFFLVDLLLLARMGALPICQSSSHTKLLYAGLGGLFFFSCLPLFSGFLFVGFDLHFHLSRIEGIASGLASGQFPVKIYPSLLQGQGYANGVFYGDILLYIPAILRLIGFSLQSSYRIYVALVNLATILVSYWCFTKMFGSRLTGFLGSALYSLNLYRYFNQYVLCAVGQYSAMIFLPLILYSIWAIFTLPTDDPSYNNLWIYGTIGYCGLILTHILTCGMTAIFTILACIIYIHKIFCKKTFLALFKIVFFTSILCLWFLVPFIDYTLTDNFRVTTEGHDMWNTLAHSVEPLQIFDLFAKSTGGSSVRWDGIQQDPSLTVGGALFLGSLILPLLWLAPKGFFKADSKYRASFICFIFAALSLWMTTTLFPWYDLCRIIPPLEKFVSTMQFPWRFLSISVVLLTVVSVYGLQLLREKNTYIFKTCTIIICFFAIFSSAGFLHDLYENKYSSVYYEMSDIMSHSDHTPFQKLLVQLSGAEYLPSGMNLDQVWLLNQPFYDSDSICLTNYIQSSLRASFSVENRTSESQAITVPFIAYKGYRATINNQSIPVSRSENGQLQLEIPAKFNGNVTVRFVEPVYWRVAEGISLTCVMLLIAAQFISHNRIKSAKNRSIVSEVCIL